MPKMQLEDYKEYLKKQREISFLQPYDLVYQAFEELGFNKQPAQYFFDNASKIVESLRSKCWTSFLPVEKSFTSSMLEELIDETAVSSMKPVEAIKWFTQEYPEYIYALTLSNTQSRRSRAGKEFEAILELLIIGANLDFSSQGNIGKKTFISKGLGKLVDVVTPSVIEYTINKRNTVLISAKTTLRERWQEVPEEMNRTGASEMLLATLDDSISDEVFNTLYEANVQIVTTKSNKEDNYREKDRILTFEQMLSDIKAAEEKWEIYIYSDSTIIKKKDLLEKEARKHTNHPFIASYYVNRI